MRITLEAVLFDTWRNRVAGATHNATPAAIEAMTRICVDREVAGLMPNNVWHASSMHYGHKCNCGYCVREG